MVDLLMQVARTATEAPTEHQVPSFMQHIISFFDTPAPYSPFSEYLVLLLLLWLLAHQGHEKRDFSAEAQKVLDQKFKKGEINRNTYEKYRQELSMRLKS